MHSTPKISSFSIIIVFVCLALIGLAMIPLLPIKLSPSYTLPKLNIYYTMPGNSARIIEQEVTAPLESMLARIRGIKRIESNSANGWGNITLELDKHTQIDAARFEASTIIRQTWPGLPEGLSYPVLEMSRPDDTESRAFLTYTLNAPSSPAYIQRYAENQIKPRLAGIAGIYRVDISGATPMEWKLEYDNKQLTLLGIKVEEIKRAINQYYKKEFIGIANRTEKSGEWIRLALVPDKNTALFDPASITVKNKNGKLIRLDQLLKITHQEEAPRNYYRINGLNSIYLSIRADETANQLQLAKKIKEEMKAINLNLPAGYQIHTGYDATEFIRKELNKIYIRSGLTICILMLFVLLLTRNVKYMFLLTVSLTINLTVSVILYYFLKLEMQLYSLAGITISLSLLIDNTIVMTDHIKNRHNKKAFLPILAATLTTIGALSIIFFLDEKIRLNLQDFAAVVIINLAVSLLIALFFVPAMIDKLGMFKRKTHLHKKKSNSLIKNNRLQRRIPVYFSGYYFKQIKVLLRWKFLACIFIVLAFGLPFFMMPEKIEMKQEQSYSHSDSLMIEKYNLWTSNTIYKEQIKPVIDKFLGGSLRLFVENVYEGSYFTRPEEIVLSVTASMPNGTTLSQMNTLIGRMESFLSGYDDIRQFQTNIFNERQARIDIFFPTEAQRSGFPYILKNQIINKALELGGGSWSVYGLQDHGFSNDVRENAGSFRIEIYGYNYDELYKMAEQLKNKLLSYARIKEVLINSEYSWWKEDYQEYTFLFNKTRMAQEHILPEELFSSLGPVFGKDIYTGSIIVDNELENMKLTSKQSSEYDIWSMQYIPQSTNNTLYKLNELVTIEKVQSPQKVVKINQQYRLCLQYEYIGASSQGTKIQERVLDEFNAELPMGYRADSSISHWEWNKKDNKQYLLILVIILIIFLTCSILFNSLRQPLAVIFVIPISYIGVFLTFYCFKLNFDQGGFAGFILLCGITVNASIYILNEYNSIRKRKPLMHPYRAYLKAWNIKITPIFLTVVSTVLGFIPFILGPEKEGFWFPLAAGTIGGLIMSVIGIFIYLPVFVLSKKSNVH